MVDQKSSLPAQLENNNLISGIKANTIDKNGKSTAHLEILLKQALHMIPVNGKLLCL